MKSDLSRFFKKFTRPGFRITLKCFKSLRADNHLEQLLDYAYCTLLVVSSEGKSIDKNKKCRRAKPNHAFYSMLAFH